MLVVVVILVLILIAGITLLVIRRSKPRGAEKPLQAKKAELNPDVGTGRTLSNRVLSILRGRQSGRPAVPKKVDLPQDKKVGTARLLWIPPLGFIGCHRYYLARYVTAALYTIGFFLSLIAFVFAPFHQPDWPLLVIAGLLVLGWLVDGFLLHTLLNNQNRVQWQRWFGRQSDRWTDVAGTVRDLSRTTINTGRDEKIEKQQMNFRIEETDTEGNVTNVIEVELIGQWITGNLRNGDSVAVRGKMSRENILRAVEVDNKTTNSRVTVSF